MTWVRHRLDVIAPFGIAIALFFVTAALIPGYGSIVSIRSLFLLASLLGIASAGQTLTIIMGGIDLSVPAVIGLACVGFAVAFGQGVSPWVIGPIVIVAGIAIGAVNGLISRALRVNSLIVTLATATVIYGAIWAQTKGDNRGSVPDALTDFVSVIGWTGPIPLPGSVILWAVLVVAFVILERRSVLGRWVYASGANPGAAELARIPSLLLWTVVFAISGGLSAVAGILLAGFSSAANPQVGDAYLFTTLSAVVIGGTPIIGGRGGYARTVAGCFIITELTMLLIGLGLDEAAQQVSLGILIIVLVAIYGREPHVRMQI
ncbi:MAG TPA: ABC transporter permease [Stellaceae bacterium]|nr:ABC transporter permease [Stellaceae bacterium]